MKQHLNSLNLDLYNEGYNSIHTVYEPLRCPSCRKYKDYFHYHENPSDDTHFLLRCVGCESADPTYLTKFFDDCGTDFVWGLGIEVVGVNKKSKRLERSKLTKSLRYDVLKKYNFKCATCGVNASKSELVIDHIQPIVLGGRTEITNLQALCVDCNQGKGAKRE